MIQECNNSIDNLKSKRIEITPNKKFGGVSKDAEGNKVVKPKTKENIISFLKEKKGYYLFQIPGTYINTQPFGGFNFTEKPDDMYKSSSEFKKYLHETFYDTKNYAVEIDNSGLNCYFSDSCAPIYFKKENSEVIHFKKSKVFHLDSSGAKIDDIEDILDNKTVDIAMGDSNLTTSKLHPDDKNTIRNKNKSKSTISHADICKEVSIQYPNYAVLMSNFEITKSRQGGPFINTQIYKSDSEPLTEVDGMMILFNKSFADLIDFKELSKMIESKNYILYHKGKKLSGVVSKINFTEGEGSETKIAAEGNDTERNSVGGSRKIRTRRYRRKNRSVRKQKKILKKKLAKKTRRRVRNYKKSKK